MTPNSFASTSVVLGAAVDPGDDLVDVRLRQRRVAEGHPVTDDVRVAADLVHQVAGFGISRLDSQ